MKRFISAVHLIVILALPLTAFAGSLDSPGAPSSGSNMPTLQGICTQLDTGVFAPLSTGPFGEPGSGPGSTMCTLTQIRDKVPVVDAAGAAPGEVLSGKKYWGLLSGSWGLKTGTLATQTPSNTTTTQPAGFYNAFDLSTIDTDLASGNIKSGISIFGVSGSIIESSGNAAAGDVLTGKTFSNAGGAGISGSMPNKGAVTITPGTADQTIQAGYHNGSGKVIGDANLMSGNIKNGTAIFGVAGDTNVVNTSSGDATATDIKNGKKAWVDGSEVTGTLSGGYTCTGSLSALGRWCDNGNGTVRDMTTGLIWLKDAGWAGRYPLYADTQNGANAQDVAVQTRAGNPATLTDGSVYGDWRLPTKSELAGIVTGTEYIRNAVMYKFINVQNNIYWSLTANAADTLYGWYVDMTNGYVGSNNGKNGSGYVWPVRGGQ